MDGRDDFHGPTAPQGDVKDTAVPYDGPLDPSAPPGTGALTAGNIAELVLPQFSGGGKGDVVAPGEDVLNATAQLFVDCGQVAETGRRKFEALGYPATGGWPMAAGQAAVYQAAAADHASKLELLARINAHLGDHVVPRVRDAYAKADEATDVTAAQVQQEMAPTVTQMQGLVSPAGSGGKSDA
ncbi:hypothetical protein AB0O75_46775 [Streptomyces sp. NPDC088921]|uniref:hypothetical protein n=1 Tax=unclassified Streptomyces TaxID=2593676 RepID=UPI00341E123E